MVMGKYIDAEKLIAEIDRLHKAHSGKYGCDEVGLNLEYLEDFIDSLQQEQPEVNLDRLVSEEFASHSRSTEYGLEVTYNRAELYQLIKRMALVFNARKEDEK